MKPARRLFVIALTFACGPAPAFECPDFLRMHGMLRRAQERCAFERFNPEIVDMARQCYDRLGAQAGAPAMHTSAAEFDRMASLRGEDTTCNLIQQRFPMVVR